MFFKNQLETRVEGVDAKDVINSLPPALVRPPPNTVNRHYGPNHLGLWYDALPEHQMALITPDCAPSRPGRSSTSTSSSTSSWSGCPSGRRCQPPASLSFYRHPLSVPMEPPAFKVIKGEGGAAERQKSRRRLMAAARERNGFPSPAGGA